MKTLEFLDAVFPRYRRYSRHVLGFRHFPEGRDGLLPVQRRTLVSFNDLGAVSRGTSTKTSKVSGHCFAAGTPVMTLDGIRLIENVDVHDVMVTSRGHHGVTKTYTNPSGPMVWVTTHDSRSLQVTPEQLFKVHLSHGYYWVPASELRPGHTLVALTRRSAPCGRRVRQLHKTHDSLDYVDDAWQVAAPPSDHTTTATVYEVKCAPDAVSYCLDVENVQEFYADGVCVHNCFASGTPVSTPDGRKAVEHMEVGDEVLTSRGLSTVTQTFHNPPQDTLVVRAGDVVVTATLDQEFKVHVGDSFFWKTAGELEPGDEIVSQ